MRSRFVNLCDYEESDAGVSPLLEDLVDYYVGDEESGPLLGSYAGLDASAFNSPGSAAGVGDGETARDLDGTSRFATPAAAGFTIDGRPLYIGGWVYLAAWPTIQGILVGEVNPFVFQFGIRNSGNVFVNAWAMTGAAGSWSVPGFTLDAWHFVEMRADADEGVGGAAIDGGAWSAGTFSSFAVKTTHGLGIGSRRSASADYTLAGRVAGMIFSRKVPSDASRAWLAGAARVRTLAEILAYRE